eukprot:Gregarina_sp_Poly_1__4952@NODE_2624_length_1906_cov_12_249048_g1663_i0_p1_GENE_NODE_2624_length_1906_cov_12_249048_g1663_i0NODE_2624_length_1906_cov_12_249048_g1663_i0_p1_ORF_typecomplete_len533_score69_50C2/PF00168_30/4e11Transglut_core/PF01841_19/0_00059DUF553/PF04473_12/0_009Acetyltransf_2/PF00797_17/4_2e03Acetyltransf_2/PF00797_17/0_17_NODE_2624_length_1906_cov_12_249048_g1663_i0411639
MNIATPISKFVGRGVLKVLTTNPEKVVVGNIHGNIRCTKRAWKSGQREEDLMGLGNERRFTRPEQPMAGSAFVAHLNQKEMYLIVRFFKCENLPVANKEDNSSDPLLQISWDGITNRSPIIPGTTRPVFNQNFYFPIRLLDQDTLKKENYIKSVLPMDLLSKGPIKMEIWNSGVDLASDLLGSCEIDLSKLTGPDATIEERCFGEGLESAGDTETRAGGRPFKYVDEATEEDTRKSVDKSLRQDPTALPWYLRKKKTSVWKAQAYPLASNLLEGTEAENSGKSLGSFAYFEIYVLPPLPSSLEIPPPKPRRSEELLWKQHAAKWTRDFGTYQRSYLEWFRRAISGRRWLCLGKHGPSQGLLPLPAFLTPLAVPEVISRPGDLLHWLGCIGMYMSPSQLQTGQIGRWNSPGSLLATKKGSFQDHTMLLASVLLGLGYDAYVCKGTVKNGTMEYTWVITRDLDGWVTVWDVVLQRKFALPSRWGVDSREPRGYFEGQTQFSDDFYDGHYLINAFNVVAAEEGVYVCARVISWSC